MIPFLELSKPLAARGPATALVSTPWNLAELPAPADGVRFVPLPLPSIEVLPEGAESTSDVPPDKVGLFKKAMDGLAVPLAAFLANAGSVGRRRPDWIVIDFCHHWVPPIADQHKVPCALFMIFPATTMAFWGPRWANAANPRTEPEDFTVPPKWMAFPSTAFFLRHEAEWVADSFRANASGVSDTKRLWEIMELCRLTIHRSCHELEPRMFALLSDLNRKPAIPAGILLPRHEEENNQSKSSSQALQWLHDKPPKSVLYVALGSEAPLTRESTHELALGLELARVRFLWALCKPVAASTNDDDELLPAGFEERALGRGVVCTGWVPQVKALAHATTGAFLTHCGWGSTVESFAFGHALVMLPFVVDKPLIARAMTERGVGVAVARNKSDGGSFTRDGVAAAVRRVMVEDQGKALAANAKKMQQLLVDQRRQDQYIHDLVDHLRRYKDA